MQCIHSATIICLKITKIEMLALNMGGRVSCRLPNSNKLLSLRATDRCSLGCSMTKTMQTFSHNQWQQQLVLYPVAVCGGQWEQPQQEKRSSFSRMFQEDTNDALPLKMRAGATVAIQVIWIKKAEWQRHKRSWYEVVAVYAISPPSTVWHLIKIASAITSRAWAWAISVTSITRRAHQSLA